MQGRLWENTRDNTILILEGCVRRVSISNEELGGVVRQPDPAFENAFVVVLQIAAVV